ncbi:MAG: CRISPR-associated protein Cas4 [Thermoplasmata archaeon]|nr:CRISPR-associated protein Cas4 [Thermoplasmata archaeon]
MAVQISAADIEKFGYCPLSWWLSWNSDTKEREELVNGKERHSRIAENVMAARKLEIQALTTERIVLWFAIIATIIAIFGIDLLPFENEPSISLIMIFMSLIWVLASLIFLQLAFRTPTTDRVLQYEKIILIFAIVAALVAINSVLFLEIDERLAIVLEAISLVWLIVAAYFLERSLTYSHAARQLKKEMDIKGKIKYVDMEDAELLVSEKYGISGRPDYILIVENSDIPVEVKTGRTPRGPLFSHILQLATYCLLLEEKSGKKVPYGILKYGTDQHVIDFDESLKKTLLQKIAEIREIADGRKAAHRNHNRPVKCTNCSRRDNCPERLA